MATIEIESSNITLFYSKSTGEIIQFCTGIQNMSMYGVFQKDYEIVFDYLVVPYDSLLINNTKMFIVDLTTKTVKLKQSLINYM